VVRAAYGVPTEGQPKSLDDFATQADLNADRAIMDVIALARPDDTRIGEETGTVVGSNSRRWLVDPLCGTLNFAARTPLAAVNVALVDGASHVASVSVDPLADELFWSDGRGAFGRRDGVDVGLFPSAESRLVDVNCDGPTDAPFLGPQLIADAVFRSVFAPRVISTTLAVAWVAAGRRAAYVSDGWFTDNVHFAAGLGLCQSARCVITDLAGGALGAGRGLVVAADAVTHTRLLGIIRPYLSDLVG